MMRLHRTGVRRGGGSQVLPTFRFRKFWPKKVSERRVRIKRNLTQKARAQTETQRGASVLLFPKRAVKTEQNPAELGAKLDQRLQGFTKTQASQ